MKITSWQKTILSGIIAGLATLIASLILMYIFLHLTSEQTFQGEVSHIDIINGFTYTQFKIVMIIITTLVSFFSLRYEDEKYLTLYLVIAALSYWGVYILLMFTRSLYYIHLLNPLNTWDYLGYLFPILIGSFLGTMGAMTKYLILHKNENGGNLNA